MSVSDIALILKENHKIIGIKEEAVPTAPKIKALRRSINRDFSVLTGLGGLYALFDLEAGSDGFNTGFAFPEILQEMHRLFVAGKDEVARKIYQHFLPLTVFEQQPGVGIRKQLLAMRGLIQNNKVRHPGSDISSEQEEQLIFTVKRLLGDTDLTQPISSEKIESICYMSS